MPCLIAIFRLPEGTSKLRWIFIQINASHRWAGKTQPLQRSWPQWYHVFLRAAKSCIQPGRMSEIRILPKKCGRYNYVYIYTYLFIYVWLSKEWYLKQQKWRVNPEAHPCQKHAKTCLGRIGHSSARSVRIRRVTEWPTVYPWHVNTARWAFQTLGPCDLGTSKLVPATFTIS